MQTIAVVFAAVFHALLAAALLLVGGFTASATTLCAALLALAAALHQGTMLRTAVAGEADAHEARGGAHFWCYGAGALLFGMAAGAAAVIAVSGVTHGALIESPALIYAVLGFAVLALSAALYVGADAYYADKKGLALGEALAVTVRPMFAATMVETAAALVAMLGGFFGVLFADRGGAVWMDGVTALGIAAIMAGLAALFLLVLRSQLGARAVSPALLKALTLAVAREADRIGAIKRIDDVTARVMAAGHVVVALSLTFKDGVEAAHVRAVLDKLAAGVQAEHPAVREVVLMARPVSGPATFDATPPTSPAP